MILKGQAHIANSTWIGRHEIALPSVSVRTVGAGSGSLASVANGLLRVGPESAGAVPGPACYGTGGRLPTVADADLVLGYLNPDNFLGGRMKLHAGLARRAIDEYVATPLAALRRAGGRRNQDDYRPCACHTNVVGLEGSIEIAFANSSRASSSFPVLKDPPWRHCLHNSESSVNASSQFPRASSRAAGSRER